MKSFEKIAIYLLPIGVLLSSLSIIPNRILTFTLLLWILFRVKFFTSFLLKKKWILFIFLAYGAVILFGNEYLSKEFLLFLSLPVYFLIYQNSQIEINQIKKSYVFSMFVFTLLIFIIRIVSFMYDQLWQEEQWWNLVMYKNLVEQLNGHPTYISMFILTAFIALLDNRHKSPAYFTKPWNDIILISFLILMVLLGVKILFIALFLIMLTYSILNGFQKRYKESGLTILILLLIGVILYNTPGIKHRLTSIVIINENDTTNSIEPDRIQERVALWKASVVSIKKQPFTGSSLQGISSRDLIYDEAKIEYPNLDIPKNCHNNYLEFGVRYGILALGFFTILTLSFLVIGIKNYSFSIIGISIMIICFSLTESFMFREQGISLIGIIIPIFGKQYYGRDI